jgi:3-phenylpropionate/cinnamic acid dioxygenase small subunit
MNTNTNTTQLLVDRTEILDLIFRLGAALDDGRFDEMRSLFVDDATARTPGGSATGREAMISQASRNHRADQHVQHVITNPLIEIDGDRADVRANLVVHFASAVASEGAAPEGTLAPPVQFILGEVYRFDALRTERGWRLASVETIPVWMSGSRESA